MSHGDTPSILSESQSRAGVRCATCGLILGHIDTPCPNCLGGKRSFACETCRDTGEIEVMTQGLGPDDYTETIACPDCGGSGDPLAKLAAKTQLTDDYIARLTFRKKDGTHSDGRIRICDSDSPGAFKVYRAAPISISAVIESIDDLDVGMQAQQENHRLREALIACVAVAKAWHAADDVWEIYYNRSPEMKPIRDVLGPLP